MACPNSWNSTITSEWVSSEGRPGAGRGQLPMMAVHGSCRAPAGQRHGRDDGEVREVLEFVGPRVEVEVEPAQHPTGGRVDDGVTRHLGGPPPGRRDRLEPDAEKLAVELHHLRQDVIHREVLLDSGHRQGVARLPEPLDVVIEIPGLERSSDAVPARQRPERRQFGRGLPAERRLEPGQEGHHPIRRGGHAAAELIRRVVGKADHVRNRVADGERRVEPGHVGFAATAVVGDVKAPARGTVRAGTEGTACKCSHPRARPGCRRRGRGRL